MSVPSTSDIVPPVEVVSLARSAGDVPRDTGRRGRSPKPVGGPQGGPLDTYANKLDTSPGTRFSSRVLNAQIRATVRNISQVARVRKCGHTVRRAAGVGIVADLKLAPENRIAGFRGLYSCASVWACPRCSAVIGIQRAKDVREALQKWRNKGANIPQGRLVPVQGPLLIDDYFDKNTGEEIEPKRKRKMLMEDVWHDPGDAAFLTLTIRHRRKDQLVVLWETISTAWEKLTRGNSTLKRHVPAYIRAAELTYGKNGWHLHLHVLLFVKKGWGGTKDDLEKKRQSIFSSWIQIIHDLNFTVTPKGLDLRMLSNAQDEDQVIDRMAQYLTKESATWDVAQEMTAAKIKKALGENLSMHQILALIHADLNGMKSGYTTKELTQLAAVYMEFELSSHGKRQLTWSRGAKSGLLDHDMTDEELAATADDDATIEDLDTGTGEIAGFTGDAWTRVRDLRIYLQEIAETKESSEMNQALTDLVNDIDPRALYGFYVGDGWNQRLSADEEPRTP